MSFRPDSNFAVQTHDMRVDYGDFTAVHGLTMQISPGEVFGLVGPNGSGKTSSFNVMATLMEPTYGDVSLCGIDISLKPGKARELLGYMPDLAPVPSDLLVWEFLDLFGASHGLSKRVRGERIDRALHQVNLHEKRNAYCKDLSRGMKQRLCLAKTLLHQPKVLLLDEPASGMDPISRVALRETLQGLAADGATVLVSSHILSELASMCTSVGIMTRGRLIASGKVDEVTRQFGDGQRSISIGLAGEWTEAEALLRARTDVSDLEPREGMLHFRFQGDDHSQAKLLADLVTAGCPVKSLSEKPMDLETILLGLEGKGREFHD